MVILLVSDLEPDGSLHTFLKQGTDTVILIVLLRAFKLELDIRVWVSYDTLKDIG